MKAYTRFMNYERGGSVVFCASHAEIELYITPALSMSEKVGN